MKYGHENAEFARAVLYARFIAADDTRGRSGPADDGGRRGSGVKIFRQLGEAKGAHAAMIAGVDGKTPVEGIVCPERERVFARIVVAADDGASAELCVSKSRIGRAQIRGVRDELACGRLTHREMAKSTLQRQRPHPVIDH